MDTETFTENGREVDKTDHLADHILQSVSAPRSEK